jgi:hypothetical protein
MPDLDVSEAILAGLTNIYTPLTNDMVEESEIVAANVDKMVWDAVNLQWVVSQNYMDIPLGILGQLLDDMLPQQMAAVIVASCDKVRCRPKKFFPAFGEGTQNRGTLIALTIAHLVTAATAWLTDMPRAPYSLTWGTLASDGTFQNLNSTVVNSVMGTQRRRKIGVGQ